MTKATIREFGHRLGLVLAGVVILLAIFFIASDGVRILNKYFFAVFSTLSVVLYVVPRVLAWMISPFFRD
jgi:hypothetical protein